MKIALIALGIGICSGVIAGLCGVGGGLVMVPAFVLLLGMPQKVAVATSLAVIIPTAVAATLVNVRNELVDKQVFFWAAVGAALTAALAAAKLKELSDEVLTKVFAMFMILIGIKLLFSPSHPKKNLASDQGAGPVIQDTNSNSSDPPS